MLLSTFLKLYPFIKSISTITIVVFSLEAHIFLHLFFFINSKKHHLNFFFILSIVIEFFLLINLIFIFFFIATLYFNYKTKTIFYHKITLIFQY